MSTTFFTDVTTTLLAARLPWMERAVCAQNPVAWANCASESKQSICMDCPVLMECRAFADHHEKGKPAESLAEVYGGETPHQRVRRRQATSTWKCRKCGNTKPSVSAVGKQFCRPCKRAGQRAYRAKVAAGQQVPRPYQCSKCGGSEAHVSPSGKRSCVACRKSREAQRREYLRVLRREARELAGGAL